MDKKSFSSFSISCHQILKNFESAAFCTSTGKVLAMKYQNLADIGSLPASAETSYTYLKIPKGQMVITNDPYSGGSTLFSMNLVYSFAEVNKKKNACDHLLLVSRVGFKPRVQITDSVEAEGIRIPPTPIFSNGELNHELADVIAQHPLCPPLFIETIKKEITRLQNAADAIKNTMTSLKLDFQTQELKEFDVISHQAFIETLGQLANGEASTEVEIYKNEKIKLHLSLSDQGLYFDFSGTTSSTHLSLTDRATLGACIGAVLSLFDFPIPICSGVIDHFQVRAPEGSMVNAKYPAPVFQGMTDGVSVIANLIIKIIGKIDSRFQLPLSGISQCSFELEFSDGKYFYETLETGVAGSPQSQGVPGLNMWRRSHLEPSVEEVERRFPLKIKSFSYRPHSGGTGLMGGGDGVTKVIDVLEPATLRWMITQAFHKPEGIAGGKAAHGPEIILSREGKKEVLDNRGEIKIESGTEIIIHSSGGGGFGEKVLEV